MIHHDTPDHRAWYVVTSADNKPVAYATTRHPFQTRRSGSWGAGYWNVADMTADGAPVDTLKFTCAEDAMRAADTRAEALYGIDTRN